MGSASGAGAPGSSSIVGVAFAQEQNLPGHRSGLPDIRYLVEERPNIAGIVLTHAHEDHYGAMLDLGRKLNVPVYATPSPRRCSPPSARANPARRTSPSP